MSTNRDPRTTRTRKKYRKGHFLWRPLSFLSILLFAIVTAVPTIFAAGGAYTLNFSAADPSIYLPPVPFPTALIPPTGSGNGNSLIPLAQFNDGLTDVKVESLAPEDMALGQIVPFETKITVSGDTTPENGVITFVMGWNTLTTNGDDFGYDARVDDIGYGVIGAFIDTGDGAFVDTGTAATVDSFTWSLINDEIVGIFTVSGLEDGDMVVLETWLVLDDTIPAGVGGNVQSRLIDAATGSDQNINVANSGAITLVSGDSISTGNQTVPLLKPSDFFTADVDLSVTKSDDIDPIVQGETLTYTIIVANAGPSVANSVVVYDELDPNVTFVSASDGGFINTDTGDAVPDGAVQWNVGSLAPGESVEYTVTVTVNADAPTTSPTGEDLLNTVTVTTISDDIDPNNDTDTEPTDVEPSFVPDPAIDIRKNAEGPDSFDVTEGGTAVFEIQVTNTGNIDLTNVTVSDLLAPDCVATFALITVGSSETYSCEVTNVQTGFTNTASVTTDEGATDSDDSTVNVIDVPSAIEIIKTAVPISVDEPGGDVTFSFVVNNLSAVDSVTIDTLNDSIYGDLNGQGTCSVPQTITAGGSYNCSITAFVSGNAGDSHTNVVTASGTDDDGNPVSDDDEATVTINDVPAAIEIIKTADPTSVFEPGEEVTFSFTVNNLSAVDSVTIDSLNDSIYGDLHGQGDCSVPQTIAAGGSYSCSFTAFVSVTETNVVTASGTDDDGNPVSDNDDATVTVEDVPSSIEVIKTADPTSVAEPGSDVTFTFTVNNTSAVDSVTINSVFDSIYGDLNGQGDCSVPQTIVAGGSYSCSITKTVSGNAGDVINNVLTAAGLDDDGNPVSGSDDADVTITDVPSAIEIIKTAVPTSVDEPGGNVTFSFVINNLSAVDSVTINSLTDSVYGDLHGQGDCSVPQTIAAGGSYSCSITAIVAGNAGDSHTNVATASGTDDDGNPVSADDDATVTIDDVPSSIEVIKTADPTTVDEPGGEVTYTFTVNNTSAVDSVTINSLNDSIYGDLNGQGDCSVPQTIAAGGSYSCSITEFVAGNAGDVITNVLIVAGIDDDGNPVGGSDDADVTINDVPSSILTTKSANPTSVPETGGDVTFTITVENTSAVDTVTINSVIDSAFGDVSASCTPTLPADLLPGESVTCTFTEFISGDVGQIHTNVATASGEDDDGNPVEDDDDEDVPFNDVLPDISIVKTADLTSVPETGGDVTFTFLVTNNSAEAATLDSLVDDTFGDLNGQGSCVVPQPLAANGGSYSCAITVFLAGDDLADHVNVVTATASDNEGNIDEDSDDETVTFEDVAPEIQITKTANPSSVPETGGDVTFTFLVENIGQEDVTLTSLTDTVFGDLNGQGDCAVPQVIAIGSSYSCSITVSLAADDLVPHVNVVTATAVDDDGTEDTDDDDETVTFEDVLPDVTITKTANPTAVPETGADVEFTIVVTNNSLEDATIDALTDSDFDLATHCADAVGTVLASGASYTCTFTEFLLGDASGPDHVNTATVTASDDDGNSDTESDDETVLFEDVLPDITVVKTANPTSVPETGGVVSFTIEVTNNSTEDAVLEDLDDTVYGDLNGNDDCSYPQPLAANGGTYTCTLVIFVSGDASGPDHVNVVTAVASDDDGNTDSDSDDATVTFEDVLPDVTVLKSANVLQVPETGGDVTFTFDVTNNNSEATTINALTDSVFGTLAGDADCQVGTVLAGNGGTCSFEATFNLSADDLANHVNVFTGEVCDNDGNCDEDDDEETVTFEDVLPDVTITKTASPTAVPETGADVEFTIVVTNNSLEDATIDSLTDSDFDLAAHCPDAVGTVLASGESYSCVFTEFISGNYSGPAHENTATVVASDNDGNSDTASDDETVTFTDVLPDVSITKTAVPTSVDEPGDNVTFTLVVTNNSLEELFIDSLTDSDFNEDLAASCPEATSINLQPGQSYTCVFSAFVAGNTADGDHENTATVVASDDDGNTDTDEDSATVIINNVAPIIDIVKDGEATINEGGDTATYSFTITNNSVSTDPLTITSLTDDQFGNLLPEAEAANGGSITLAPGASFSFTIDRDLTLNVGDTHTNVVTVIGEDDEGSTATDDDDHTVGATDVAPAIAIVKDGEATINEGGDTATYSFLITNNSVSTDPLTITSLSDDQFGDLLPEAEAANGGPITLASGESFSFTIDRDLTLNVGETHTNVVTVVGEDDEGSEATDDDDHTVGATDVAPAVSIIKDGPASINEGGDNATYDITITNDSVSTDPLTITSLVDDQFGDLLPEAEAANGGTIVLAPGDSFSFQITRSLEFNVGDLHINVVTVVGEDDEGTEATDDDDHTVAFDNVAPVISVDKTADQLEVFAPGEDVTFTVVIENNSVSTDPVTITSLVDDIHGDLDGQGDCEVPVTIQPGDSYICSFVGFVDGDELDTITASGTDDEGTPVSDSDNAYVEMVNPAITIEKSTGPADADTPPGPEILAGETVNWFYQVTNIGDVTLSNLTVTDDQGVTVSCATDTLPAGASTVCTGTGTAIVGQYANIGTATASYTDADGDVANRSDNDPSHYFGATPSVDIVKTFAEDSVIAGGAGSSFTLVVTNDGNVALDNVSVFDDVDDRLTVTAVSATAGADNDSDSDDQTVEWLIANLGVGESVTITVEFSVNSSVPEVLGLPNTAVVSDTYIDDFGNSTDIGDEDDDTIDILVDIALRIVKTFDPTAVPQGTQQSFTIEVFNDGPSDAVDVSVTDSVHDSLAVVGVSVTSGVGDCSASAGQEVDCTVQIPAGDSVLITVDYLTAPFASEDSPYDTTSGDDFRFVFLNGSVLEGSTDGGPIFLDGVDITNDVTILTSLTRNDIIFDPPGDDPAFELHLSCSDPFTGGWGQSGGPVEGVDVNWQIAFFTIARYNSQGFLKSCGNVVNPFEVPNTATATGADSFGTETVSDDATVTIEPGITIDRLQLKGKRLTARLTNYTGEPKEIVDIEITWPESNGDLIKVWLTYGNTSDVIWSGDAAPSIVLLDVTDLGWNGGTLFTGEAILRFDFRNKVDSSGYTIRVNFADGTFLDINQ
ncbi:DUF7507 domain-containing protein [Candidatus Leptofilum sp.]|uniref:DUF7507 domain-containing protein n=1 Tax=Candidatus Leptofilum sp. TaxID=3241576 RepID=UPI003B5B9AD9